MNQDIWENHLASNQGRPQDDEKYRAYRKSTQDQRQFLEEKTCLIFSPINNCKFELDLLTLVDA